MENSIYWHDYETFGKDPRRDRPCQFAGIRTDEDLNIIDDPQVLFCRPAPDFLPDPEACLVTGISPREAAAKGRPEAEFCAAIHREFIRPGTCVAGYNSIRFDDEVTRHMLYRCFYDPYEREWKNGNSRWDILDMLRLAHAVRPEGIQWPRREDGTPSFRLEDLCRANGIEHEDAHDALADVKATIEMARLVKKHQPRLYDYLYRRRSKKAVLPLLEPARREPVLHVSGMYPAARGSMAVVVPLARHPSNNNGVVVYDLAVDPASWLSLDPGEIRRRLFTPAADLEEDVERIPLKTVHANKCPVLAPLSVLNADAAAGWGIDLEQCKRHLSALEPAAEVERKVAAVFGAPREEAETPADPDLMLYSGGFFGDGDRAAMAEIRALPPDRLADSPDCFNDSRLKEMLFRYRARNFPDLLAPREHRRWREFCRDSLLAGGRAGIAWEEFWRRLPELEKQYPARHALLGELRDYARELGRELEMPAFAETGAEA